MTNQCVDPEIIEEAKSRLVDAFALDPRSVLIEDLRSENTELYATLNHPPNVLARLAFEQYLRAEKLKNILRKILKDKIDVLDLCGEFLEEL